MPNILAECIKEVITENLLSRPNRPVLIWYDEEGTLKDLIPKSIPSGIEFLMYKGSYLEIRTNIERNDPKMEKKWFVYIPVPESTPSWILDYETFGSKITFTLERLLVERLGIHSNSTVKYLLSGLRGRLLASNWDDLMSEKQKIDEHVLVTGLIGIIFELGRSFSVDTTILEYLSDDKYGNELERFGLHSFFGDLISSELGLVSKSDSVLTKEDLVCAILFSELVSRSNGIGMNEFKKLLPNQNKLHYWVRMLDNWQENDRLRNSFFDWSNKIEEKYDVAKKIKGFKNLVNVKGFKCIDDILVKELVERIELNGDLESNIELTLEISRVRNNLVWSKIGKILFWKVIQSSLELYKSCKLAKKELIADLKKDNLIARYSADEGWWNLDRLYLDLASSLERISQPVFSLFVRPATIEYFSWLDCVGRSFCDSVSKSGRWESEIAMNQQGFWQSIVGNSELPTVIFFIDALRFDLAKMLEKYLVSKGFQVKLQKMLSSVPSITEICMPAMLPDADENLSISIKNNDIQVFLSNTRISNRADRVRWLSAILERDLKVLTLSGIENKDTESLKKEVEGFKRIVIMDREIDKSGTFLSDVTLELFYKLVNSLAASISKLHEIGLERIIITTDHGFLLVPREQRFECVSTNDIYGDFEKGRRFIIGNPTKSQSFLSFQLKELRLSTNGLVLFPYSIRTVGVQGESGQFIHGGISLQENCIAVLISSSSRTPKKIQVAASIPSIITTSIFYIELAPVPEEGRTDARRVFVETTSMGEPLYRSEMVLLEKIPRTVRIKLKKNTKTINVDVIDADSKEILFHSVADIELEGYDELL